jgi:hypothetical protein
MVPARRMRKRLWARRHLIFATMFFPFPLLEDAKRHKDVAAGLLLFVFTLIAVWDL